MSYPPPGDPNQPPQYPSNQPPQQPPQPPQQPYGSPPSGYGYPPSSGGGYGYGDDGYAAHMERPGVVTAGSVIAIVLSGLSAITSAAALVAAIVAWDTLVDELRKNADEADMTAAQIDDFASAQPGVVIAVVVWLVIAAFGVFLGVMTMRGQNWARITLTVFAGLTALIALLMITSIISAVWLLGSIACIICVFVGGANDWFRYRKEQRRQPY